MDIKIKIGEGDEQSFSNLRDARSFLDQTRQSREDAERVAAALKTIKCICEKYDFCCDTEVNKMCPLCCCNDGEDMCFFEMNQYNSPDEWEGIRV